MIYFVLMECIMNIKFNKHFIFLLIVILLCIFDICFFNIDADVKKINGEDVKLRFSSLNSINVQKNNNSLKHYNSKKYSKSDNFSFDINSKNIVFPGCSIEQEYNGEIYINNQKNNFPPCITFTTTYNTINNRQK